MAAIITEHTVADLVRSKLGLVEFPESATVGEAIEALVREDLVAAPVYSTSPHAAAALGSLARSILSLPDDSDALSLTAAANKAYIGTVTMVDLLLHHPHKPLASSTLSSATSLSLEHLQGVPDAFPYKQPQYTPQAGSTVRYSECNTRYSCSFPSEEEEETEQGERGGKGEGERDKADYNIPPTTPAILPTTPTNAISSIHSITTAFHHSSPSPCFRCPGGSCMPSRKFFCPHFCVLTQTDVARWLLDRAPQLEPVPSKSLLDLGLIHPRIVTVKCSDNAYEALQLLQSSAGDVNALAVVDPALAPASPSSSKSTQSTQSTQGSSAASPASAAASCPHGKLVGQLSSVDLRGCTAQFAARNLRSLTVQDLLLAVPATERSYAGFEYSRPVAFENMAATSTSQLVQSHVSTIAQSSRSPATATSAKSAVSFAGSELHGAACRTRTTKSVSCNASQRQAVQPRASADEPLLVRAARGEAIPRPPAWMMRQAGRYMAAYQKLSKNHPSFRERSETTDLIVEITLQPWRAFRPDGVILFSDILTPLEAMGIPFEIDENKGPVIDSPIRTTEALKALTPVQLDKLHFVDESLRQIRKEIEGTAALLGFVGAPWTLATYCVEGGTTRTYTKIKGMIHSAPDVLRALLQHLANEIATYAAFQVDAGAQCIQVFDSWGGQLPPDQWDEWAKPYIIQVISQLKAKHPTVPVVLYANGSGGLMERMATTGADVIGVDWTIDMADARTRIDGALRASPGGSAKPRLSVQGNVDPAVLFASKDAITDAIHRCVAKAGPRGHILNLGHGVLVGTPEESVLHFFETTRALKYAEEPIHQIRSERVYEGGFQDSYWVRGYGIHRFFCETYFHPHQQHHCRIVINQDIKSAMVDTQAVW
ncbi:unnamed protein product [Closterium sp. Yama58-4]|nr:unnamed protein product [Closterium sp. Yama58-4]